MYYYTGMFLDLFMFNCETFVVNCLKWNNMKYEKLNCVVVNFLGKEDCYGYLFFVAKTYGNPNSKLICVTQLIVCK